MFGHFICRGHSKVTCISKWWKNWEIHKGVFY